MTRVTAVDVNLTVTEPTTSGHITAWPGDLDPPCVSNVNFAPGQTVANHAVVPVSFDEERQPYIAVRNSNGDTHLIVDVQGWYDDEHARDRRPALHPLADHPRGGHAHRRRPRRRRRHARRAGSALPTVPSPTSSTSPRPAPPAPATSPHGAATAPAPPPRP